VAFKISATEMQSRLGFFIIKDTFLCQGLYVDRWSHILVRSTWLGWGWQKACSVHWASQFPHFKLV